jgi:hypothetical protein
MHREAAGSEWSRQTSQLMQAARAGSAEALGRLLEGCRAYLLLAANRQLDADLQAKGGPSDLVQETFLEAQKDFPPFQGARIRTCCTGCAASCATTWPTSAAASATGPPGRSARSCHSTPARWPRCATGWSRTRRGPRKGRRPRKKRKPCGKPSGGSRSRRRRRPVGRRPGVVGQLALLDAVHGGAALLGAAPAW